MTLSRRLAIDVFADPVCPWCYLGWRALGQAIAMRPEITITRTWRPFLLNPRMPKTGVDRAAWGRARFATDPERAAAARAELVAMADRLAAPLALDAAQVLPSTLDAHRVILWGYGQKLGEALVDAVFTAFWVDGADLGQPDVLADVAAGAGLDRDVVTTLLARDDDVDLVLGQHEAARRGGVTGVPMALFDRKLATQGAAEPLAYAEAIDAALRA